MRMYDIIKKKRDGLVLTKSEIDFFVEGYVNGDIPDYQAAALLMAIFERDMTFDETQKLTYAIRDSGEKLSLSGVRGAIVDQTFHGRRRRRYFACGGSDSRGLRSQRSDDFRQRIGTYGRHSR